MQRSETSLSNEDRVQLAQLVMSVRDSVADKGPVSIYGFADGRYPDARRLADERAKKASVYLQSLGIASDRIEVQSGLWKASANASSGAQNQIEIEFLPRCLPADCPNPCDSERPVKP